MHDGFLEGVSGGAAVGIGVEVIPPRAVIVEKIKKAGRQVFEPSLARHAVYEDLFNTNTGYLNGGHFFSVVSNPNLSFRLGRPQVLKPVTIPADMCKTVFWTSMIAPLLGIPTGPIVCPPGTGAIMPEDVPADEPAFRSYAYVSDGHANAIGLYDHGASLQRLMAKGLLIDVAHMSERAIGGAITLARRFGYPLMNSHTGLRDATKPAVNERDLTLQQATEFGKLGGLLGMGTTGGGALKVLANTRRGAEPRAAAAAATVTCEALVRNSRRHNRLLSVFIVLALLLVLK